MLVTHTNGTNAEAGEPVRFHKNLGTFFSFPPVMKLFSFTLGFLLKGSRHYILVSVLSIPLEKFLIHDPYSRIRHGRFASITPLSWVHFTQLQKSCFQGFK